VVALICALAAAAWPVHSRDSARPQLTAFAAVASRAAFSAVARGLQAATRRGLSVRNAFSAVALRRGSAADALAFAAYARKEEDFAPGGEGEFASPVAMLGRARLPDPGQPIAEPDRSRLAESMGLVRERLWDPYGQNTLKGDRPIYGNDWYLQVGLESETTAEAGRVPNSALDMGSKSESLFRQQVSGSLALIRGDTAFKPPQWQLRIGGAFAYTGAESLGNRARGIGPGERGRRDGGIQEAYIERFLGIRNERYDFRSIRMGIQPFISDFRGFLIEDRQPAVRWFGTFASNRIQHNLVWMRRLRKDRDSGLNTAQLRDEDLLIASAYLQDAPWPGFQLGATAAVHIDREDRVDGRAFSVKARRGRRGSAARAIRPQDRDREHKVAYLGLSGDGHIGWLNLTAAGYTVLGRVHGGRLGQRTGDVRGWFGAVEASMDFDWYRLKAYALYASGDRDPRDRDLDGFDSVRDRPTFGGIDGGFFQRESIPLSVGPDSMPLLLTTRDGLLPSLRDARDRDAANFAHPGLRLAGIGADLDVLPELRVRLNASVLEFDETASLSLLRGHSVSERLGQDYSVVLIYRPLFINNIVARVSAGAFRPGPGFSDALGFRNDIDSLLYSVRAQLVLTY
jgi:hypothetical protein